MLSSLACRLWLFHVCVSLLSLAELLHRDSSSVQKNFMTNRSIITERYKPQSEVDELEGRNVEMEYQRHKDPPPRGVSTTEADNGWGGAPRFAGGGVRLLRDVLLFPACEIKAVRRSVASSTAAVFSLCFHRTSACSTQKKWKSQCHVVFRVPAPRVRTFRPRPGVFTCTAEGSGCCDSGCDPSCFRLGRDWMSWRRRAAWSDCPWWGSGSRVGGAATWGLPGRCGSDSGQRRVAGGFAEPAARPAGCGARTLAPLSRNRRRRRESSWSTGHRLIWN